MLGRLTPIGGGPPLLLLNKTVTLGRDPSNDHAIPCGSVSSKHCELQMIDGYWWVRDLGSRNGTAVNNVRCQKQRIMPGEILRLANQRFRLDYRSPSVISDEDAALNLLLEATPAVAPQKSTHASTQSVTPQGQPIREQRSSVNAQLPVGSGAQRIRRYLGKLVPCGGGDPIGLLESPLLIGRRSACDIALRFPDVSSRHCTLTFEEGFWVVEDLGSRNGIRVNGERVERKVLMPEDRISVAGHRFIIQYTPEGIAPPSDGNTFSKSLLEKIGLKDLNRLEQRGLHGDSDDEERPKRMTLE